jgi:hypothetical protein
MERMPADPFSRVRWRSGKDLKIGIDFSVIVEAANANDLQAELKQILADLGLQDSVDLNQT